jgi:DNA-binding winged helix-turn-helix (wHTH) protein
MSNGPDRLRIDPNLRELWVGARRVEARLSPQEFALLECLSANEGATVARVDLGNHVWGAPASADDVPRYDDHMLHALVSRVRRKLKAAGVDLNTYLVSVPGVGYRLLPVQVTKTTQNRSLWKHGLLVAGGGLAIAALAVGAVAFVTRDDGGEENAALSGHSPAGHSAVCGSEMISPEPGSVLSGSTVNFQWTPGCGMIKYDFWAGCAKGAVDFYNPDDGVFTEATVPGLPVDGGPVYVRLTSSDGTEEGTFSDFLTYTAADEDASAVVVEVPGNAASWVDSGIDVHTGDGLTLDVCGQVEINSTGHPAFPASGDAECPGLWRPSLLAPDLPCWSLIGRLVDGAPFLVGTSYTIPSGSQGRLYLGVNDNNHADNAGSFRITLRAAP